MKGWIKTKQKKGGGEIENERKMIERKRWEKRATRDVAFSSDLEANECEFFVGVLCVQFTRETFPRVSRTNLYRFD